MMAAATDKLFDGCCTICRNSAALKKTYCQLNIADANSNKNILFTTSQWQVSQFNH